MQRIDIGLALEELVKSAKIVWLATALFAAPGMADCIRGHWDVIHDSADPKERNRRVWVCDEYQERPRNCHWGTQPESPDPKERTRPTWVCE